ncbi:MAG: hypothetical protein ABIR28_14630, partial [Vicinamibacteria bacterium]
VAALSGFASHRVPFVYDHMTLLVITLTALGFYKAWSAPLDAEDATAARWRGVLVAASVLGLSSFALAPDPPIHHFWQANFVFKPNHALAFGLVGLLSRGSLSRLSWLHLGLLQALLIWAFILDWAYALPGLLITALVASDRMAALGKAVVATIVGLVLSVPYLMHLLRDYNPVGQGEMPQIWRDQMGERLTSPYLWSLDLGPLLLLFVLGLIFAIRNAERHGTGFLLTGPLVALCYVIGLQIGFAPEPDEGFYYWRMVAGAGAGYAAWILSRESGKFSGRRGAIAFGLMLACSYPAYFNPVRDDRYFRRSSVPLDPQIEEASKWIRENTTVESVLISSEGVMLSGLTGRRFLMVRPDQTADRVAREGAEADILTSLDERTVRRAIARYGITHVVVDDRIRERYGEASRGLGNRRWFRPVFVNAFARIVAIRPAD